MLGYTLRRLLGAIPTIFFVMLLAFMLVRSAPGGPFDSEVVLAPQIKANIEAHYKLDQPLPAQFWHYFTNVLQGDFGPSYFYRDSSVTDLIAASFPLSMRLGSVAMLLALVVGVAAGIFSALRQNTLADRLVMGFAMTGISVPMFVVAPVLLLFLAVKLQWLPAGWSSTEDVSRWVLPVLSLALPQIAYIARLTRASLIDVLNSDFIRTARAQGLSQLSIVRHHAFKPAMLPVLSYLGPAIAIILTGSVVIEQVFGIPGVGRFFVLGALNRDYTLVLGIVIFYAALIIVLNLLVDILYGLLDPMIRTR